MKLLIGLSVLAILAAHLVVLAVVLHARRSKPPGDAPDQPRRGGP